MSHSREVAGQGSCAKACDDASPAQGVHRLKCHDAKPTELAQEYVGAYGIVKHRSLVTMDYVAGMRGAALGARLRRLSALIDLDAGRIYQAEGVQFEQRWFGILNQLALKGPLSVGALAEALGVSHPSISETRQSLERAGLIQIASDPADARRRLLALSTAGKALAERLKPVWDRLDDVARELDEEAGQVVEALARLEVALQRRSLLDRMMSPTDDGA